MKIKLATVGFSAGAIYGLYLGGLDNSRISES